VRSSVKNQGPAMREVVSVHVGQCGNAIGAAFWNLLLLEHEKTADNDPILSSFFYQESHRSSQPILKARALLIDMECGPLQETMRSSIGSLFDETQYIMDVSGAGNNFAQGYYSYGPKYHDHFIEGIRKNVEKCESLQAFFLTHSLGGGTGSGVGSYVLHLLADEYSKITRFSTCVYPSEENDVITSPYNIMLSTKELIQSANCVFPMNNSSLFSFYQLEKPPASDPNSSSSSSSAVKITPTKEKKSRSKGFEEINGIVARVLCNITSSSRFHGEMNVDLNEIYTNLVPFPKLHFLATALNVRYPISSQLAQQKLRADYSRTALKRAFSDITGVRGQLSGIGIGLTSHHSYHQQGGSGEKNITTLASAFLGRGKIIFSDFISCVQHAQQSLTFPSWNQDACKVNTMLTFTVWFICFCSVIDRNVWNSFTR
jgi:tubulin epsilon